jgi:hypothetical protein
LNTAADYWKIIPIPENGDDDKVLIIFTTIIIIIIIINNIIAKFQFVSLLDIPNSGGNKMT